MAKRKRRKNNPELSSEIDALKMHARGHQPSAWRDVARKLEGPSNGHAVVNVSRLNRHTKSGDIVIVAGKVLGAGLIDHPVSIGASSFSAAARSKILAAGGTVSSLDEIANMSPRGGHLKIIR